MPSDLFSGKVDVKGQVMRVARVSEEAGVVTYLLVGNKVHEAPVLIAVLPGSLGLTAGFVEKGDEVEARIGERVHGSAYIAESLRIRGVSI